MKAGPETEAEVQPGGWYGGDGVIRAPCGELLDQRVEEQGVGREGSRGETWRGRAGNKTRKGAAIRRACRDEGGYLAFKTSERFLCSRGIREMP